MAIASQIRVRFEGVCDHVALANETDFGLEDVDSRPKVEALDLRGRRAGVSLDSLGVMVTEYTDDVEDDRVCEVDGEVGELGGGYSPGWWRVPTMMGARTQSIDRERRGSCSGDQADSDDVMMEIINRDTVSWRLTNGAAWRCGETQWLGCQGSSGGPRNPTLAPAHFRNSRLTRTTSLHSTRPKPSIQQPWGESAFFVSAFGRKV